MSSLLPHLSLGNCRVASFLKGLCLSAPRSVGPSVRHFSETAKTVMIQVKSRRFTAYLQLLNWFDLVQSQALTLPRPQRNSISLQVGRGSDAVLKAFW